MKFCIVIKRGIVLQVIGDSDAEFTVADYDGDAEEDGEPEPVMVDSQKSIFYDVDVDSPDQDPALKEIFNEAFGEL